MKIAPLADVKARLSASLVECGTDGPVLITRNGKVAAILLAPKDEEDLERLVLAHSRRFLALLEKSRRSIKAGRGVSHNEFWKTVALRHKANSSKPRSSKAFKSAS
ncbi:MAG: type II toxin-antitoxin system Phd/YefM family antitoxin [Deltaproteobacteria bacterium]|nr:type II toxin-antitoxin system Phd/YefM family antitoxin [Deltaproteobacteria bacterium]